MSRYSDLEKEIAKLKEEIAELQRQIRILDNRTVGQVRLK